jgi:hypothetical protein
VNTATFHKETHIQTLYKSNISTRLLPKAEISQEKKVQPEFAGFYIIGGVCECNE